MAVLLTMCFAVALAAAVALALQVFGLRRRLRRLERSRDVERRHREHLTLEVEKLRDRAAGARPERDEEIFGVVVNGRAPRFRQ